MTRPMFDYPSDWEIVDLTPSEKNDIILVSGHEGTICGLLHYLLQLKITNYPTFKIGNCDFVKITINNDNQMRYRFYTLESLS